MNVPNIIFDVALMALPLGWLWRIHNTLSQKIALGFVYALAGFVVAVGALRLQSLVQYGASTDFTWDFIPIGILTALESNSALVCACLPTLNPLLQFCLHGTFTPLPTVRSRPSYQVQRRRPRGQQRDLSEEEAEELARITQGEAPRNYPYGEIASEILDGPRYGAGDCKKTAKQKKWRRTGGATADFDLDVEDGILMAGLEPPPRVKKGWATPTTPKESRFSDW